VSNQIEVVQNAQKSRRAFKRDSVNIFLHRPCRLAGLASLGPPSSWGRFGSLALPFAGATRPCVGRARTSRRVPPARLRCAVSPSPRLRLFRPVSRPVCGFEVSGSASLCVA
jgi:hypothetical protein